MREQTKMLLKMKDLGITFSQLAEKLSTTERISASTVFQWADGRRVPSKAIKKAIKKILGVKKISDLF